MRTPLFLSAFVCFLMLSCSSVRVTSDYDSKTNFQTYKTFAFYKKGIDRAPISDLDKRRIMSAIQTELSAKGLQLAQQPDMLVSIYTKSREQVQVRRIGYDGFWYAPFFFDNNQVQVTRYTEGTLFVDFIDPKTKQIVWQGIGSGALRLETVAKKEERIKEFVKEIIAAYPVGGNETKP